MNTSNMTASDTVFLRRPVSADLVQLRRAYGHSVELHHPWTRAPVHFRHFIAQPYRYLVCRRDLGQIAGTYNISHIIRGGLQSAFIGYEAFSPHQRQGFMFAGMQLLLRIAFDELCLHRLEANIQPDNLASRALAVKCGFVKEGFSAQYLRVNGVWKDHERWALVNTDWRERRGT